MMIREALQNINERKIKSQPFTQVKAGLKKQLYAIAKKNYLNWWSDELPQGQERFNGEKAYLAYINVVIEDLVENHFTTNDNYGRSPTQFWMEFEKQRIRMIAGVLYEFPGKLFKELNKFDWKGFYEKRGYYLGNDEVNQSVIRIIAHANYDEEMTGVGEYIYHITDKKNLTSIKKTGLKPHNGNKIAKDLPRVYVTKTLQSADKIFQLLSEWEVYNLPNMKKKVLLAIDTSKLRKGTKFYTDLNFKPDGCWTYTHIPADAIEIWDEYDLM